MKKIMFLFITILYMHSFGQNDVYDINLIDKPYKIKNKQIILNGKKIYTKAYKYKIIEDSVGKYLSSFTLFNMPLKKVKKGFVKFAIYTFDKKLLPNYCKNDTNNTYKIKYFYNSLSFTQGGVSIITDNYKAYIIYIEKVSYGNIIFSSNLYSKLLLPMKKEYKKYYLPCYKKNKEIICNCDKFTNDL